MELPERLTAKMRNDWQAVDPMISDEGMDRVWEALKRSRVVRSDGHG